MIQAPFTDTRDGQHSVCRLGAFATAFFATAKTLKCMGDCSPELHVQGGFHAYIARTAMPRSRQQGCKTCEPTLVGKQRGEVPLAYQCSNDVGI